MRHILTLVALGLSALLAGLVVAQATRSNTQPQPGIVALQAETPTPTLEPPPEETSAVIQDLEPIETEAEAIARSMNLFPTGHYPHDAVARLNTYSVIDAWRHTTSPDTEQTSPAWLVGILGDTLTIRDLLSDGSLNGGTPVWPADPVDGAFYVWDANGGWLAGQGILSSTLTYASLVAVPSLSLTITKATDLAPYPTLDPTSATPGSVSTPTPSVRIESQP